MPEESFVHLHTHSHLSLEDGVPSVEELVERASELGYQSLALTDHDTLAGLPSFTEACRKHHIKPICGCELSLLSYRSTLDGVGLIEQPPIHHATLLVRNESGFRNLVRLVTRVHRNALTGPKAVSFEDMEGFCDGLLFLTGCHKGELYHLLKNARIEETEEYIHRIADLFGKDNIFFELIYNGSEREKTINGRMIQLAQFLRSGIVATNNVHYIYPEDEAVFLSLEGGETILEAGAGKSFDFLLSSHDYTRHLADTDFMRYKFKSVPESIETASLVADMCNFTLGDFRKSGCSRLPLHDFDRGRDADSYIWDYVFEEAAQRYGDLSQKINNRLNEEFDVFKQLGMENYLVFIHHIAEFMHEKGYLFLFRQQGVISSLTAYLLGLTSVDPVKHKIRFQPPATFEKGFEPALFEMTASSMDNVVEWINEFLPPNSLCRAGVYQNWTRSALIGKISKWARLDKADAGHLSQLSSGSECMTPQEYRKFITEKSGNTPVSSADFLNAVFSRLHPRPRGLTPRKGHIAFCSRDLENIIPCEPGDIAQISQFPEDMLDDFGLHRLYMMQNPMLEILNLSLSWVKGQVNPDFSLDMIPMDDPETFQLLAEGLTDGIPPLESITVKSLLRKMKPSSFMELNILIMEAGEHHGSRTGKNEESVAGRINRCLYAYQTAYIKTHFPSCFMTAALTHAFTNSPGLDRFISLLRQTKSLGISIKPPGVNESMYSFTLEADGIRTGLMVVQKMGESAFNEIMNVRKSGLFQDLTDLCGRTDSRLLNRPVLTNLIKAGALDGFSLNRKQQLELLEQVKGFSKKEGENSVPSFFNTGEEALLENVNDLEEFSPRELIAMEHDAAGYPVTRYPLEPYEDMLRKMNALSRSDLSDKHAGVQKFIAGFIDYVDNAGALVKGRVSLVLDFEGLLVKVPDTVAKRYSKALKINRPVLIGGEVELVGDYPALNARCIYLLDQLKDQVDLLSKISIDCAHPPALDKAGLKTVHKLLKKYKGNMEVEALNVPEGGGSLAKRIGKLKIFFSPPLYFELRELTPPNSIKVWTNSPRPDDVILESW